MAMYIKIIGNVFSVEEKETKKGVKFAIVKLAVNSSKRDDKGNFTKEQEDPFFIDAVAFGKASSELFACEDGKFFGRISLQAKTIKDENGKYKDVWNVLKITSLTGSEAEAPITGEAVAE